ncbi:hypothetical protein D047_1303A, partial [Vibrio parahaemolyticus VPTS-2010_2]|jgi:hypothetical protein
MVLL